MKRLLYATLVLVCLGVAFFAGFRLGPRREAAPGAAGGRAILYYVDPMNPAHTSEKPGLAPCGMKLEPVYADSSTALAGVVGQAPLPPGAVKISADKQQLMGVRVLPVEKTAGTRTLRTLGTVALDETRIYRVATSIEGWVRSVGPVVTGSLVKKDDFLAGFYSREFITAQQTYLYALNTMDRYEGNESEDQMKATRTQMKAAEDNLSFLGVSETQMKEIARTRKTAPNIELRSPVAGLVLARNAFTGLRFDRGTELFRLAELDHVWILADVFENEGQDFRPGSVARVMLRGENKSFEAKVSDALPQFDPAARTLKVRLEADNPGLLLRPDMFVDVELTVTSAPTITVPADAVLDSGLRKTVFIERTNGVFEPRTVQTGWRSGERVEIAGGLTAGERIVVAGNFLLDSESRMKLAAAGLRGAPATDPVCAMTVDEASARAAKRLSEYQGQTYYFCSDGCKKKFEADPAKFLGKTKLPPMTMVMAEPKEAADPVCGMKVDVTEAKAAKFTSEHQGKAYFFCNETCKKKFDEAPGRYVAAASAK